jgi:hypothetical protein
MSAREWSTTSCFFTVLALPFTSSVTEINFCSEQDFNKEHTRPELQNQSCRNHIENHTNYFLPVLSPSEVLCSSEVLIGVGYRVYVRVFIGVSVHVCEHLHCAV